MSTKKAVVFGATGTIGKAVVAALAPQYQVLSVSKSKANLRADLTKADSIRRVLAGIGKVDAIVSAAGDASFKPLAQLTEEDFLYSARHKLMGQVNLVRLGLDFVNDGGAIVVTTGILAHQPMVGSAAISMVNAGLEGFIRAAALEAPRGIRLNVVSPPWVSETLIAMGMDPKGGKPAAEVAKAYVAAVAGKAASGSVLPA